MRQLLTHTAGLTVHGFPGYGRDQPHPTVLQVLDGAPPANTPPVRVQWLPGLTWRYSGGGTTICQLALSDLTGQPFPELMRDLVLAPCGMADSTFDQPLPEACWERAATGHVHGQPVPGGWHVYPEMAAAGLWSTPSDLVRLALAVSSALRGDADAILPAALAAELATPQGPGPPGAEMGLGFTLQGSAETRRLAHDGRDEGFLTQFVAAADGTHAFAAMANGDDSFPILHEIVCEVATTTGWFEPPLFPPALGPDPYAAVVGTYRSPAGQELEVARHEGGLALVFGGHPALPVRFDTALHWETDLRTEVYLVIESSGGVTIGLYQHGDRIDFRRQEEARPAGRVPFQPGA